MHQFKLLTYLFSISLITRLILTHYFLSGFSCSLFTDLFAHILTSSESVSHRTAARTLLAAKVTILPRFLCLGYSWCSLSQILLPSQAELLNSLDTSGISTFPNSICSFESIVKAPPKALLKFNNRALLLPPILIFLSEERYSKLGLFDSLINSCFFFVFFFRSFWS